MKCHRRVAPPMANPLLIGELTKRFADESNQVKSAAPRTTKPAQPPAAPSDVWDRAEDGPREVAGGGKARVTHSRVRRVALLLCIALNLRATTEAVAWGEGEVILGADSNSVFGDGRRQDVCKIKTNAARDLFFMLNGTIRNNPPGFVFDVEQTLLEALDRPGSLFKRVGTFVSEGRPIASMLVKYGPPDLLQYWKDGGEIFQAFVVSFVEGKPSVYEITFRLDLSTMAVAVDSPDRVAQTSRAMMIHGVHDHLDRTQVSDWITKYGRVQAVRMSIQQEIDAHPGVVGPPISILKLDKDGPHWIDKGLCGT
jgi:hypothetical protein